MANRSRLIMGTALGLATIAVAIDHTRHRLPEPQAVEKNVQNKADVGNDDSPCRRRHSRMTRTRSPSM